VHLGRSGLTRMSRMSGRRNPSRVNHCPSPARFPGRGVERIGDLSRHAFPGRCAAICFRPQHNSRKVGRHVLSRAGSTFKSEDLDFVSSADPDFHPSDVLEDADGSLLVVDTGGWYVRALSDGPHPRLARAGRNIPRPLRPAAAPSDPWGLKENWNQTSVQRLIQCWMTSTRCAQPCATEFDFGRHKSYSNRSPWLWETLPVLQPANSARFGRRRHLER